MGYKEWVRITRVRSDGHAWISGDVQVTSIWEGVEVVYNWLGLKGKLDKYRVTISGDQVKITSKYFGGYAFYVRPLRVNEHPEEMSFSQCDSIFKPSKEALDRHFS